MKTVMARIGNMRKPQEFVVYPNTDNTTLKVQSDTCIAQIDVATGNARFANVPGGAYFSHLLTRGQDIIVPLEIVQQFVAAKPKSGDKIGNAGIIA